ncbi:hypothetical protein GGX14DRAFT_673738 [Mycena pura]|uniref:Uncharacterized protein n=1 Tax=Mycena pura TaxID=153505 RepID=A0AAD6UW35_9AGAR|nr:hypothetical protein GGX14DRAFT_673738 [Mycena pura]
MCGNCGNQAVIASIGRFYPQGDGSEAEKPADWDNFRLASRKFALKKLTTGPGCVNLGLKKLTSGLGNSKISASKSLIFGPGFGGVSRGLFLPDCQPSYMRRAVHTPATLHVADLRAPRAGGVSSFGASHGFSVRAVDVLTDPIHSTNFRSHAWSTLADESALLLGVAQRRRPAEFHRVRTISSGNNNAADTGVTVNSAENSLKLGENAQKFAGSYPSAVTRLTIRVAIFFTNQNLF